jgi:hypothetical protein
MAPTNEQQPYPCKAACETARASEDPIFGCWFCGTPSVALAARYSGGDEDIPAHWLPVCATHLKGWHDDVADEDALPVIPREGVGLTFPLVRALLAALLDDDGMTRDAVNDEVEDLDEAITALQVGLRFEPTPDSTPGMPGNDDDRYQES